MPPLDLNREHSEISGKTHDDARYRQDGCRYKADHSVCKGSTDPHAVAEPEPEIPKSAAELAEAAEEVARRATAQAQQARLLANQEAGVGLEEDPLLKPDPTADVVETEHVADESQGPVVADTSAEKAEAPEPTKEAPELPIEVQMDGDIGNAKGQPYKTQQGAEKGLAGDEGLRVVRTEAGFFLRTISA